MHVSSLVKGKEGREGKEGRSPILPFLGRAVGALLIISVCAGGLPAQEAPPAEPPPAADALLSIADLEARIAHLAEAGDLPQEASKKLQDLYRQAIERSRLAEEWRGRLAEFEKRSAEAPGLLETLKAELAEPPEPPWPEIPREATLAVIEQLAAQAEADHAAAVKKASELEAEPKRRSDRRQEVPTQIAATKQRLAEVVKQLAAPPPSGESSELSEARRQSLLARKAAMEAELAALEQEVASYEARGELLTLRRELAARQKSVSEKLASAWQETVLELRRMEAEEAARLARAASRQAANTHPAVKAMADRNRELAELRTGDQGLAARIERSTREAEKVGAQLTSLEEDFKGLHRRLEAAGLTDAIGLLLRRKKVELPRLDEGRRAVRERQQEIARVQLNLIELEDERAGLGDIASHVRRLADGLRLRPSSVEREAVTSVATDLLQTRRTLLDSLIADHNTYFVKLVDLDASRRALAEKTEQFEAFINEHILWISSTHVLGLQDARPALRALLWFLSPANWLEVAWTLTLDVREHPGGIVLYALLLLVLFAMKHRGKATLEDLAVKAGQGYTAPTSITLKALFTTLLIALPWPAFFWCIGDRLARATDSGLFTPALGRGSIAMALLLLSLEILRQVCRRQGLAVAHFRWKGSSVDFIRRKLRVLMVMILPTALVVWTLDAQPNEAWNSSLGRISFIEVMLAAALFAHSLLAPGSDILQSLLGHSHKGMAHRLRHLWYVLGVGLPLGLAITAATGYYYTAFQLGHRLHITFLMVSGVVLANAVLMRWLYLARGRLAIEQVQRRRAAQEETEPLADGGPASEATAVAAAEREIDLTTVNVQTRKLVQGLVGLAFLVGFWWIWADVAPALNILDRVDLWTYTSEQAEMVTGSDGVARVQRFESIVAVTLQDVILAGLVIVLTMALSSNIPGMLEITLLQRLPLDPGGGYAITTLMRYGITVVGMVVAFGILGIGWSSVQWLVAAMTVGLGFGLQEIFANFVSGLIILFERPIRVGDTVSVGDTDGTVSRIRIRATTITDWDRKELVIPNKEFITGRLINWTLTDTILRVVIPVGIAYGSDTRKARELLLRVAAGHRDVLKNPSPKAWFMGFGDSSLNLSLRVFVASIDDYLEVTHALHTEIDDVFRKAGIEIAFPQRDLHLRGADLPLRVLLDRGPISPAGESPATGEGASGACPDAGARPVSPERPPPAP